MVRLGSQTGIYPRLSPEAFGLKPLAVMKTFYVNLVISILLIVGGFLVPPVGIIDGSVLTTVGLLLMFSVIEKIPEAIKAGKNIKVQKGDSSVEISNSEPSE